MTPGILVAGIGNIFLGDDAFGCEVIRKLLTRQHPAGVRIFDYGIRGFDLTYALLDGPENVIMVDAVPRGEAPGTIYVIEPELNEEAAADQLALDTHGMNPVKVLQMVRSLGGRLHNVLLVGCEPESFGLEDEGDGRIGLSASVAAAVDEAAGVIESLIAKMLLKYEKEKVEVT